MKNLFKVLGIIAILAVIGFSMAACGGGEKSINSADALKTYLDSQPANSPDKPIKVAMKINENMVEGIKKTINSAGKYVSLNLTGSPLTTIPGEAFRDCKSLVGITIPTTVTIIDTVRTEGWLREVDYYGAFYDCTSLATVTFAAGSQLETIGAYAFYKCTSLTSITIPNSVTKIVSGAFSFCDSLTSVTFAEGSNITHFGSNAFPPFRNDALGRAYLKEGAGTYTRDPGGEVWKKQ